MRRRAPNHEHVISAHLFLLLLLFLRRLRTRPRPRAVLLFLLLGRRLGLALFALALLFRLLGGWGRPGLSRTLFFFRRGLLPCRRRRLLALLAAQLGPAGQEGRECVPLEGLRQAQALDLFRVLELPDLAGALDLTHRESPIWMERTCKHIGTNVERGLKTNRAKLWPFLRSPPSDTRAQRQSCGASDGCGSDDVAPTFFSSRRPPPHRPPPSSAPSRRPPSPPPGGASARRHRPPAPGGSQRGGGAAGAARRPSGPTGTAGKKGQRERENKRHIR